MHQAANVGVWAPRIGTYTCVCVGEGDDDIALCVGGKMRRKIMSFRVRISDANQRPPITAACELKEGQGKAPTCNLGISFGLMTPDVLCRESIDAAKIYISYITKHT